jgi:bisphosphoglycerate-independent phosphoglycerate mutase (AlkP superfamily)
MNAIEFLKTHRVYEDDVIYNSVGEMIGTISQLMEEYSALRQATVVEQSEKFYCASDKDSRHERCEEQCHLCKMDY